jgi:hypothetical protein
VKAAARTIRRWCSAGALACSLLAGCATQTPVETAPPPGASTVALPSPKPGEFWEYAVRDAYTGLPRGLFRYTVTRVDPTSYLVDVTRDGQLVDTHVYAPGWNGIQHPMTNLQRFRYEPAFPEFEFPLYPGKSWRRVVRSIDPETGRSYNTHVHASVGGWHRIRVPAGEFDALPVTRYVYAGNAESFTLQEEIYEVDWYAPQLGYVVVREGRSSHIDTSRSGGRHRPLRVRGDWLIAELVQHASQ